MLVSVVCSMVVLHLGQAYPTYSLQGYNTVPAVPGLPTHEALTLGLVPGTNYIADTPEVARAKEEFMAVFREATNGMLRAIVPNPPVQDTAEVREAKEEFFRIFNNALNGVIETVYIRDTEEVRQRKREFFGTFDSSMTNLIETVQENYLPYTADVQEARDAFSAAYSDAEAGKVGRQYLEDTPEVKKAKEEFFTFFQFAMDGLLYKLAPVPGQNVIPAEISQWYIKDDSEVAEAKAQFDQLYRDALGGDLASAVALTVLQEHGDDLGGAVEELEDTLAELEVIEA